VSAHGSCDLGHTQVLNGYVRLAQLGCDAHLAFFSREGNFSRGKRPVGMSREIVIIMHEKECIHEFVCEKCN